MKVLALVNEELRNELLSLPVSDAIQWQWITRPGEAAPEPATAACIDLLFENSAARVQWLKELGTPLVIINSVITTLDEIGENFVRINGWATFLSRPVVEASCRENTITNKAEELFGLLARKTEWVPDIAGLITPRIVASIINEAFLALEEGVSVENEIDTAMKLGTNYPYGPFEWGNKIGFRQVYLLLEALSKKQQRYQPSAFLKGKILV